MPGNNRNWSGIWRAFVLVLLLLVIAGYWSQYHSSSHDVPRKLQAALPSRKSDIRAIAQTSR